MFEQEQEPEPEPGQEPEGQHVPSGSNSGSNSMPDVATVYKRDTKYTSVTVTVPEGSNPEEATGAEVAGSWP